MAKIIITIEDVDTDTSFISAQVLKFARPGEPVADTPAKVLGDVIEAALQDYLTGHSFDAYVMPLHSTAQH